VSTELEKAASDVAEVFSEVEVQCEACGWSMMVRSKDLPVFCNGPQGDFRGKADRHERLACHIVPKDD
jgi:hypothetical protein